jgi:hypothetical protein
MKSSEPAKGFDRLLSLTTVQAAIWLSVCVPLLDPLVHLFVAKVPLVFVGTAFKELFVLIEVHTLVTVFVEFTENLIHISCCITVSFDRLLVLRNYLALLGSFDTASSIDEPLELIVIHALGQVLVEVVVEIESIVIIGPTVLNFATFVVPSAFEFVHTP